MNKSVKPNNIILPSSWKTTRWSGGTTSELLILPVGSEFKKGDYDLRISIATVEIEESTFTPLPKVNRILTILDGEIELIHAGQHSVKLKQYEQDTFLGDWRTKSIGKVKDFNVMTKGCIAEVPVIHLTSDQSHTILTGDFLFVAEGNVSVKNQQITTNQSVFCQEKLEIKASEKSVIILVRLKK